MAVAKIRVGEEEFDFPDNYTFGDFGLIELVTGLSGEEFAEKIKDPGERGQTRPFLGMVAVAVWHAHPNWTLARVARFVQELGPDQVDIVSREADELRPPDGGAGSSSPPESEKPSSGRESSDSPGQSDPSNPGPDSE